MAQWIIFNDSNPDAGYYIFDESYGWKRWVSGAEGGIRQWSQDHGVQLSITQGPIGIGPAEFDGIPTLTISNGQYVVK